MLQHYQSRQRPTLPCLETKYHWRERVSLSSSGWDRVYLLCYNHRFKQCYGLQIRYIMKVKKSNSYRVCNLYIRTKNKTIRLLVPISFTLCSVSTFGLSTWSSSTALMGIPCFKGGFPLRCIQRLSRPHLATQRCSWRNNWYTRGASFPVLSY